MNRSASLLLLGFCFGCGPSTPDKGDASPDGGVMDGASAMDGASMDSSTMDVAAMEGGGTCTGDIDALATRNCTRCWPATGALCTKGRPDVVRGMVACLTNGVCWDLYDPNSAGPCMQTIIDANADAQVKAVQKKRMDLGCPSWDIVGTGAVAAMMSDADRVTFATCVGGLVSCDSKALEACFAGTAFDPKLCKN